MHRSKLKKNIYNKKRTDTIWKNYKKQHNFCVKLLRRVKNDYFQNLNVKDLSDNKNFWKNIKGATKSYSTHYSCVVIVLFNTALCRSVFSTVSFGKLLFRLSVLSVFFCFESNVLNQDMKIRAIMLCNFST